MSGTKKAQVQGVLSRLRRDTSGNVLAITAAAVLPMVGFVGVGVDMSRAYLVRTRLQQACDAGVLAGRRSMGAGGSLTTPVKNEITNYVKFNFPDETNDTTALTVSPTLTAATDTINLSLSTNMNTAIMRIFGKNTVAIGVDCSARDDYSNIDIMLVLDTTGSMACAPSKTASECSTYANTNGVRQTKTLTGTGRSTVYYTEESGTDGSRMQALRDALSKLQSQMGEIEKQFNLADSETRKRIRWSVVPFSMGVNAGLSTGKAGTTLYARNPTWFNRDGTYKRWDRDSRGYTYFASTTSKHSDSWIANTWDGCVEERTTSSDITATSSYQIPNNLPGTANDLKFDQAPNDVDTRWTMMDPSLVGNAQYACPKAMLEWTPLTTTQFNNYFKFDNGFVANGGTFLDVGMLWAARMLSRTGMWKNDNPGTYNGFGVKRYLILMTDGEMDTGLGGYSTYGQEEQWRRVSKNGDNKDTLDDIHTRRWMMTCAAIKNMDVTIFSISFSKGSALSNDLKNCATRPAYAYKADDSTALENAFRDIGENIGSLRLSQ
ncbi:pilus assembly protein TadG-related protein [Sphingomonas xinjiangensis]|uniref:Flp pilus assembly protein TadG n=1 Tax=Sphingomonas xinjiangensis TaxID=643568 RepID=A0A840YN23_9SPHN|nr:Flp pilus assembly protein TadG [Sphingomonas xinjiangensis]